MIQIVAFFVYFACFVVSDVRLLGLFGFSSCSSCVSMFVLGFFSEAFRVLLAYGFIDLTLKWVAFALLA